MAQNTGQGNSQPINQDHTTRLQTAVGRDFVVVAGLDSDKKDVSDGNKARFVNQATRMLRLNKANLKASDRNVYLSFRGIPDRAGADGGKIRGHIGDAAHEELKRIVTERHGAIYMFLDSADELVNFINSRGAEKRVVKKLDIFTHGYTDHFAFGYQSSDLKIQERYNFWTGHASRLQKEMFDFDSLITSWSCRTGTGNPEKKDMTGKDPMYDKSLAQVIANATQVKVLAFRRRSDYANTYGISDEGFFAKVKRKLGSGKTPQQEKDEAEEAQVRQYKAEERNYGKATKEYDKKERAQQARLAEYRKTSGNEKATFIPGDPPPAKPVPPKKPLTDEAFRAAEDRIEEGRIYVECGLPIKLDGAIEPVIAGTTPLGLPDGQFSYEPKK